MQNVILSPVSIPDLVNLIANEVESRFLKTENKTSISEPPIRGIHELAKFLRVSAPRAQQLKNEGIFPYFQNGRTLLFDPEKVRDSMNKFQKK